MDVRMSNERLAFLIAIAVLTNSLLGCGKTNLSEYRPAKEHAAATPEQVMNAPESVTTSDSPSQAVETEPNRSPDPQEIDQFPVSALVPVNVVSSVRALMSIPTGESRTRESAEPKGPYPSENANPTDVNGSSTPGSPVTSKSNQIELLIKDKKFQTVPKTGELRVSFDDIDLLKVLNMEPVVPNADELMPDWLKGLDGKSIRIRGFMYPTYETEGIERFVLARDNQICCFGRDPKIYDLVQVDMKSGKTTNYIPATRAFDVVGTFRIKMMAEDGKPYGLYLIEQATVIDR
jgi:hypothetical protein